VLLSILCFGFRQWLIGDNPIPSARSSGSVLSAVSLQKGERIVIDYTSDGCRDSRHWLFSLTGEPTAQLAVVGDDGPLGVLPLSSKDCKGLNDLLEVYRHPDPSEGSTTTNWIKVEYFRGEEKVGSEEMIDKGDVEYCVYRRDEEGLLTDGFGHWITLEMVSFPQLMKRMNRANQALVPTPASVTPTADAPVAPDAGAAHL